MTRPSGSSEPPTGENTRTLSDIGEDAIGFGQLELRTVKDCLLRPAAVLQAYMVGGPTGGGDYARPMRLFLTLCGILMLQIFLMGGTSTMLEGLPPEEIDPLLEAAGKSRDAFMADADSWMSLVLVPITAGFYAVFSAPLLRWWDKEDLGWRRSFRATFHFLNVWTIPFVPLGFLAYHPASLGWSMLVMTAFAFAAFLRVGKGRWYESPLAGFGKATLITLFNLISTFFASVPIMAIGVAGGILG
jgi:hypothetical protein